MNYEWKKGSYCFKTSPQVAGEFCENLEKTVGLTPQSLLDASRDESSPLHNEFEWDDGIAAENYRRHQARTIIGNLVITIDEAKDTSTRVFFKTTEQTYDSLPVILKNEDKREVMLDRAYKELESFKAKYETLCELQPVFEAIDEVNEERKVG